MGSKFPTISPKKSELLDRHRTIERRGDKQSPDEMIVATWIPKRQEHSQYK